MKTFSKLIVALAALGIATANAQGPGGGGGGGGIGAIGIGIGGGGGGGNSSKQTPGQAAAIKAVEDAVKTGNTQTAREAMSRAAQAFPEMAGALVIAAIRSATSPGMIVQVAYAAGFAAPGSVNQITLAISSMSGTITSLVARTGGGGDTAEIARDVIVESIQMVQEGARDAGGGAGGGETEEGGGDGATLPPVVEASAP